MSEHDEKPKNEEPQDPRSVEWSFDFSQIGDSIQRFFEGLGGDEELQTSEFSAPKGSAQSARLKVKFSVGKANIGALEPGENLLEATLKHIGEVEFKDEGDSERRLTLKQKEKPELSMGPIKRGFRALANRDDLEWTINLSPDVPLSLEVDGGVGPTVMDLSRLQVRKVDADTGVGTMKLILPVQDAHIDVDVDGGVGQTDIFVPDNADVMLDLDGGVGATNITIPRNAAIQIKANGGLGAVNVPKNLKRLDDKEFMEMGGMWQSDGFELAERKIMIRYDGGIGQLTVRESEIV